MFYFKQVNGEGYGKCSMVEDIPADCVAISEQTHRHFISKDLSEKMVKAGRG